MFHAFQRLWRHILLITSLTSLILNHGHGVVQWCVQVCQSASLLAAFVTLSKVGLALINYLSPSRYWIHEEQSLHFHVSMYNFKWIQCSSNRKTRKYNDTLNENELNIYCLFEDCSKQWIISSECYVPQTVNQKLQRYAEWYELNIHYLLKTVAK